MRREKEKPDEEKCKRAFTVVIAITVVLSVCVGIVAVENESLSAGTTQNVNSAETGIQESFYGDVPFEIKVPQGKEKLKVPQKESLIMPQDDVTKDVIIPGIFRNKPSGLRIFSFTRDAISAISSRDKAEGNFTKNVLQNRDKENSSVNASNSSQNYCIHSHNESVDTELPFEMDRIEEKAVEQSSLQYREAVQENKAASLEEPSSQLAVNILNETSASVKWITYLPGEFAAYIPYEKERLGENIEGVKRGIEDLFLQDVENINITEGKETLLVTFDLKGDYATIFVTGKCRYTYELATYAPISLDVLKIVIPQNKTLVSVNPGPNAVEGNEFTYHDYN